MIPENISELSIDELKAQVADLRTQFDAAYEAEAPLDELGPIAEAIKVYDTEIIARETADEQATADRAALAESVHANTPVEPDPEDEPVTEETDPAPVPSEVPADQPELITASARKASPRKVAARSTRPIAAPASDAEPVVITASADVPGYSNGQNIGRVDVAKAMHARARGLGNAKGKGARFNVATIETPIPEQFVIREGGDASNVIDEAVRSTLEGRDAAALVAAGGWCAPSENLFDQFSVESRDGLLDLPTVGVSGGGVNVPSYFGISDAAAALWTWTEDSDKNALLVRNITNVSLTSNVATVTTASPHLLTVGQTVTVNASNDTFDGTYVVTSVTATTFTYAKVAANVVSVAATGSINSAKGCLRIPCPTWTDYRLEAEGLCVTHGNLMDRAYPEMTARFVDLVMTAHLHRLSNAKLAKILATATAVTVATAPSDAAGDVLNALDLQVADYRSQHLMGVNTVMDGLFPLWWVEAVRSTLAMRAGVEMTNVSNAEVVAHFTNRNVRPQFLHGYDPLYRGSAAATGWPATSKFTLMATGAYVGGDGGGIDLGVTRDSTLNSTNDFTAAWSEQFYSVIRRGPAAREVTVTIGVNGRTGGPEFLGA